MEDLQERLQYFITSQNLSVLSFEKACGLAPGSARNITRKSYRRTFNRISSTYPQLNMEWLLTGKGDMLRPMPVVDIDINKSRVGGDQVLVGDMIKIGDPEALCKEEETVCSLRREIDHLHALLKEKDARIASYEDQIANFKEQLKDKNELIAEYRATINDMKSQLR